MYKPLVLTPKDLGYHPEGGRAGVVLGWWRGMTLGKARKRNKTVLQIAAWPHFVLVLNPANVGLAVKFSGVDVRRAPPAWVRKVHAGKWIEPQGSILSAQEGYKARASIRVTWHEQYHKPIYLSHCPLPDMTQVIDECRRRSRRTTAAFVLTPSRRQRHPEWDIDVDVFTHRGREYYWPSKYTRRIEQIMDGHRVVPLDPPWAPGHIMGCVYVGGVFRGCGTLWEGLGRPK